MFSIHILFVCLLWSLIESVICQSCTASGGGTCRTQSDCHSMGYVLLLLKFGKVFSRNIVCQT
jgi:hypothetical protein